MITGAREFAAHFDVSRETLEQLETYHALLLKWNPAINLVSKSTIPQIWHRHFADSAQLLSAVPDKVAHWLDIGSGAGFPGLVVAILGQTQIARVTLLESDARKSAFLSTVIRELNLSASVLTSRIEQALPQNADIISARALASMDQLLEFALRHRNANTKCLFLKGQNAELELTAARQNWHMDISMSPSVTSSDAAIVKVANFSRVGGTD